MTAKEAWKKMHEACWHITSDDADRAACCLVENARGTCAFDACPLLGGKE